MELTMNPEEQHLTWDVVLRHGDTIYIRPMLPGDEPSLLAFLYQLSESTLHQRFFDLRRPELLLAEITRSAREGALVLVAERQQTIVALAQALVARHSSSAEVAFVVADSMQGTGIGTRLLERLAAIAVERRIRRFYADVLPANQRMLEVFLDSGYEPQLRSADGITRVTFTLDDERAASRIAERNRIAATASMQTIFSPRSVAVVGASRRRGNLGAEALNNLVTSGFTGEIFPINPTTATLQGLRCYPSILDVDAEIDLALIAVPAVEVERVIDDCIAKHVRSLVVISAGFSEIGDEGRVMEQRVVDKIRSAGIRMVGPNCMGVLNTDPEVRLHGTFAAAFPPPGNVAMSTQSGALGLAILDYAKSLDIGFSTFISVGNKADVSGNDLIQYWAGDERTDVILLYLESFGNPRRFSRIAPLVSRRKPIVAVKSGRSISGARAAASHTGALAASDAVVDALFRQSGVIRTDSLEEMFDVAALLSKQPLPRGTRVGIVTNAGGPAILAADACEARGLTVAEISAETRAALREFLPPTASVSNPVDMIASATPEHYRRAIEAIVADPSVDALLVIYIPVLREHLEHVATVIRQVRSDKTIVSTFLQSETLPVSLGHIPSFPFPERAVAALARAASYGTWRARPAGTPVHFDDIDLVSLRRVVDAALVRGGQWLQSHEIDVVLDATRLPRARSHVCTTALYAAAAAEATGFPVAMKSFGREIVHKSDVGGVVLGLRDTRAVREAFFEMREHLGEKLEGVIVQEMITEGVEVVIGMSRQPGFGPVIAFGSGGTLVEWLRDISLRIPPLNDVDIDDLISETRCHRLLSGFRGGSPSDVGKLREILGRLSALVEICPEIAELDLNPVKAGPERAVIVDARIRVAPVEQPAAVRRIVY